jgi:hypothetical protein
LFGQAQGEVIRGILQQFDAWTKETSDTVGRELTQRCRQALTTPNFDNTKPKANYRFTNKR